MKVMCIGGARPNFVKLAPLIRAFRKHGVRPFLVHTGQHYDYRMSAALFRDLKLPRPDAWLRVGSASHAVQTARIMVRFEEVVQKWRPDWVVVVGDVNSTVAAALVAAKLGIRVAHVEAGLRSFDRSMPEEINRVLTDAISDALFTTSRDADGHLKREGIPSSRIHFAGNVMIDTLKSSLLEARRRRIWRRWDLPERGYTVVTVHRPSNTDDARRLREVSRLLESVHRYSPVIFPVHPRTQKAMERAGCAPVGPVLTPPLSYLDFLSLLSAARCVVTDSGGIQEECTVLNVPCVTLRPNTERPVTQTFGTNALVSDDPDRVLTVVRKVLQGKPRRGRVPPGWDGHAAERIVRILKRL